ncbi:MAG: hypothetical protein E5V51_02440 [Mesorhizobium sp.]|nr:MAG: hypothetical protein E5V51_02440 [Mesorhizobium sp.]
MAVGMAHFRIVPQVEKAAVGMNAKSGCRLGEAGQFQSAIAPQSRRDPICGAKIQLVRGRIQAGSVTTIAGFGSQPVADIGEHPSRFVADRSSARLGPIVVGQPVAIDAGVSAGFRHQELRVIPGKPSEFYHVESPLHISRLNRNLDVPDPGAVATPDRAWRWVTLDMKAVARNPWPCGQALNSTGSVSYLPHPWPGGRNGREQAQQ